jgi:2-polyprenyl-3-methyl-5-hydroxy-6-metoxy-1,4-benzoquinol methylase
MLTASNAFLRGIGGIQVNKIPVRYYSSSENSHVSSSIKKIDLTTVKSISDEYTDGGWGIPSNMPHKKALPNHYDMHAKLGLCNDDYFNNNDRESLPMNNLVAAFLQSYRPNCRSILDMTCGAGSQVFYLTKKGYDVTGSDINVKMLEVAKNKALKLDPSLQDRFHVGDMCSVRLGKFDAVISMFNAVGHLTKKDFKNTILNVKSNLNKDGVYIFDIYNADYLRYGNNIAKLTIDLIENKPGGSIARYVQHSDIDNNNILRSYSTSYEDSAEGQRTVLRTAQTLQVYTAEELVKILDRCGFNVLEQCGVDRAKFSNIETERIFTIAEIKSNCQDSILGEDSSFHTEV